MKRVVLSRELLHLAIERGAAREAAHYIEGAFAAQHSPLILDLSRNVTTPVVESINLDIPGYDIEWVD